MTSESHVTIGHSPLFNVRLIRLGLSLLGRHVCQSEQIAKVNLTLERSYDTPDSISHRLRHTTNLSSNNLSLAPAAKHQQVNYLGIFSATGKLSMLV